MQEEFIEIIDEIAGECVTQKRFYDEVTTVLQQRNAPAAASKPEVTNIESDSEQESETFPHEDAEITDGDKNQLLRKQLLTNKEKERRRQQKS
jgi:hypothetical protein